MRTRLAATSGSTRIYFCSGWPVAVRDLGEGMAGRINRQHTLNCACGNHGRFVPTQHRHTATGGKPRPAGATTNALPHCGTALTLTDLNSAITMLSNAGYYGRLYGTGQREKGTLKSAV